MTPQERRRSTVPRSELLTIDHAGALTEQLELALTMLSVACDLLAQATGKERSYVVWTLERACT